MATRKTYKHSELKDSLGRLRTQSLFWEWSFLNDKRDEANVLDPIFTNKDHDLEKDGIVYPSLKLIYMSYDHIPGFEYEFALDMFNSWDHWERLANASNINIKNMIKSWREELEIKLKANAIKALITASKMDDAKGFNAAKYLADKGYSSTRGRPSKEEVERETRIQAGVSKDLEADMERLGLKVITGNK